MSALHDYLRNCFTDKTKASLLLEGQPPQFIEGEIGSFNDEFVWIGLNKKIRLNEIIAFPETAI